MHITSVGGCPEKKNAPQCGANTDLPSRGAMPLTYRTCPKGGMFSDLLGTVVPVPRELLCKDPSATYVEMSWGLNFWLTRCTTKPCTAPAPAPAPADSLGGYVNAVADVALALGGAASSGSVPNAPRNIALGTSGAPDSSSIPDVLMVLPPSPGGAPSVSDIPVSASSDTNLSVGTAAAEVDVPPPTSPGFRAKGFKLIREGVREGYKCAQTLEDDTWVYRPDKKLRSHEEARQVCEDLGARLCTPDEMQSCVGLRQGQGSDTYQLWTDATCDTDKDGPGHTTMLGMGMDQTRKGSWGAHKLSKCLPADRNARVQCCADAAP